MDETHVILFVFVISLFTVALYFYPLMPQNMATHWQINGNADAKISKLFALFFFPVLSVILLFFLYLILMLPRYKHNSKFKEEFEAFIVLSLLFIFYVYLLIIFWNLRVHFNFYQLLAPAISIFFFYIALLVDSNFGPFDFSPRNIREVGALLFKISSILFFVALFFPAIIWWVTFSSLILVFIYLVLFFDHHYHFSSIVEPEKNHKHLNK